MVTILLYLKFKENIYKKIKNLTERSNLFRLIFFIILGVLRIFQNTAINIIDKYKKTFQSNNIKPLRVVFIAPLNSQHFKSFLLAFEKNFDKKRSLEILLINSAPEYFVSFFDLRYRVLEKGIYYLLGYRSNPIQWRNDIHHLAYNNLVKFAETFIENQINKFKPEIIWLHDLQSSGYLINNVLGNLKINHSNLDVYGSVWGNDLYHFCGHPAHHLELKALLPKIDYLHTEAVRDERIASNLGFSGQMLPVCSITLNTIDNYFKISKKIKKYKTRDIYILLKGDYPYRTNLNYFFDHMKNFPNFWINKKILLIGPSEENRFRCEKLVFENNMMIDILNSIDHEKYINFLSRSKYHLSCNLSDGIPNSAAEAVFAGCLPVFSTHTGLVDLLNKKDQKEIVYNLDQCDFTSLFRDLDGSSNHLEILQNLRLLFEFNVFSLEKTEKVLSNI